MSLLASAMSKKQRLAILKKERRKRKRKALAKAREGDGENHMPEAEEEEDVEEDVFEGETCGPERQRHHEEWLERERLAQEAFRLRTEREEVARKRQEDEERRIKEEWDLQQKKEEELMEHKQQEKKNREEAVQKMLDQAESQLSNPGPWMNPEAPKSEHSENYGTERDVQNCPFFLKTGACRFGDRCSRRHVYPASSSTLMIRGMFVTFGMDQCHRDDYDTDASLEHSEEDLQDHFLEFYHDVLPEFQSLGRVVQFKVSCNFEPHLRGNVYIQFNTEEQCMEAYQKFNGRWYAGKQLHCELCPVTRWKNAICGLFNKLKCPKGKHCNFLHVFRNPGNEFWEADRDLSPDRTGEGSRRGGWNSERRGDRSWRHRHGSRSPPRSERSERLGAGRRGSERRRRSHSREQAHSHRRGESLRSESQSSRRRPAGSRSERCRSRSRDRERDDRERDSVGSRRERCRSRSRNRERDDRERDSVGSRREQCRSRSGDRERDSVGSRRERCKSRSRSGDRERDDRERDGVGSRSRDGGRERDSHRSRERDRSPVGSRNGDTRGGRSRSGSKEQRRRSSKQERSNSRSPEKPKQEGGDEGGDASSDEGNSTHRRHKHSKKSKKKSKKKLKKKKKKSRAAAEDSSSGESELQGDEPDVKEEPSARNSGEDDQEVLTVELRSEPCVDPQSAAEVKIVPEETAESTPPELPCPKEEVEDDADTEPQL